MQTLHYTHCVPWKAGQFYDLICIDVEDIIFSWYFAWNLKEIRPHILSRMLYLGWLLLCYWFRVKSKKFGFSMFALLMIIISWAEGLQNARKTVNVWTMFGQDIRIIIFEVLPCSVEMVFLIDEIYLEIHWVFKLPGHILIWDKSLLNRLSRFKVAQNWITLSKARLQQKNIFDRCFLDPKSQIWSLYKNSERFCFLCFILVTVVHRIQISQSRWCKIDYFQSTKTIGSQTYTEVIISMNIYNIYNKSSIPYELNDR